jgi:hypothetical protein
MDFLGQNAIQHSDLIVSIRNLGALASLYRSVVSCSFSRSVYAESQLAFIGMVCIRAPGPEGYSGRHLASVPDSTRADVGSIAVHAISASHAHNFTDRPTSTAVIS